MDEKKFSWRDVFFGAFLLTVMLRVMLGIFSPSSASVSRNVSGGFFSKLAELLMKVTPYFIVIVMVVMFILSVCEIWTEWKAGNMTKKKVIMMALLWVVLGVVTYFVYVGILNMGDTLNDKLPAVISVTSWR
jgi:hypothetical protein